MTHPTTTPLAETIARVREADEAISYLTRSLAHSDQHQISAVAMSRPTARALLLHIEALTAELAEARGALEPFAKECEAWPDHAWGGFRIGHTMTVSITIGDLRRARAAAQPKDETR